MRALAFTKCLTTATLVAFADSWAHIRTCQIYIRHAIHLSIPPAVCLTTTVNSIGRNEPINSFVPTESRPQMPCQVNIEFIPSPKKTKKSRSQRIFPVIDYRSTIKPNVSAHLTCAALHPFFPFARLQPPRKNILIFSYLPHFPQCNRPIIDVLSTRHSWYSCRKHFSEIFFQRYHQGRWIRISNMLSVNLIDRSPRSWRPFGLERLLGRKI